MSDFTKNLRMVEVKSLCGHCSKMHEARGLCGVFVMVEKITPEGEYITSFGKLSVFSPEEIVILAMAFVRGMKQLHPMQLAEATARVQMEPEMPAIKTEYETKKSN